jgi:hypothetical protein
MSDKSQDVIEHKSAEDEQAIKEILEFQKTLEKFNNYKNAIDMGTFPGRSVPDVAGLRALVKDLYDQTYQQLQQHPQYSKFFGDE